MFFYDLALETEDFIFIILRWMCIWIKFGEVGDRGKKIKITVGKMVFNFSYKTSCFDLVFAFFE